MFELALRWRAFASRLVPGVSSARSTAARGKRRDLHLVLRDDAEQSRSSSTSMIGVSPVTGHRLRPQASHLHRDVARHPLAVFTAAQARHGPEAWRSSAFELVAPGGSAASRERPSACHRGRGRCPCRRYAPSPSRRAVTPPCASLMILEMTPLVVQSRRGCARRPVASARATAVTETRRNMDRLPALIAPAIRASAGRRPSSVSSPTLPRSCWLPCPGRNLQHVV